jgi:hypothetical protein
MRMDDTIIDRIAFGGVKELEEVYQNNHRRMTASTWRVAGS